MDSGIHCFPGQAFFRSSPALRPPCDIGEEDCGTVLSQLLSLLSEKQPLSLQVTQVSHVGRAGASRWRRCCPRVSLSHKRTLASLVLILEIYSLTLKVLAFTCPLLKCRYCCKGEELEFF